MPSDFIGDYIPKFGIVAGIVGFSLFLASYLKRKILSLKDRFEPEKFRVVNLLGYITYIAILSLGLITALGVLGINVTALVAGFGLTGFAVGFALKDIISNALAGILIILYSPFRIGDVIKVGSHQGRVVEINLRYTVVEGDGERILIPNSTMFTNIITVKKE